MDEQLRPELDRCKLEAKTTQEFREAIPEIVNQLVGCWAARPIPISVTKLTWPP